MRALELPIVTASRSGEVLKSRCPPSCARRASSQPIVEIELGPRCLASNGSLPDAVLGVPEKQAKQRRLRLGWARHRSLPARTRSEGVLKRLERSDLTVHGFRSTFSDWCTE